MRRLLLIGLWLLLGLAPWSLPVAAADGQSELKGVVAALEAGQDPVRIVAFGDSITGVYYHTGGRRAWCDMLALALGRAYPKARLEMFNAGISGNSSAQGLARIDKDVLSRKPHLVVVMFGMNDVARAKREQFVSNLSTIVKRCRGAGAAVILSTPNSVYNNPVRPTDRLADYAQAVREVARELHVPLADCYRAYEEVRTREPLAWKLLMSETIHPSLNGHKLFAEVMAETVCGKRVSLADVEPPPDSLRFTLACLRTGKPVSLIAMPPYDRIVPDALRRQFPAAVIKVTSWPCQDRSLADLQQWAGQIRKQAPTLVVVAVPAGAGAQDEEAFVRAYAWVVNLSVDFGPAHWDRVSILPSVTGPLTAEQQRWEHLAKQVIRGADSACIARQAEDSRPTIAIIEQWVRRQVEILP